jgi:FkbM family methyltransferase
VTAPLFSIVIPTRNRAALLRHALRSALEQQFDDFEVVVGANNCTDETSDAVAEIGDDRVQYFETGAALTMPDNWELAWTKARGRYVIYLPDDDALVPSALRTIAENGLDDSPPVISWEDAPYYYPDWHDPRLQNQLLLFHFGNQLVEEVPADVYRTQCARFEFAWSSPLPKLLNCAADRAFFDSWRQRLGRLFVPIAPDYSFAWISAHVCESIRVIHRPLNVRGISDHSIGSNAGLGSAGDAFFKEFGDFDFFSDAPVNVPISLNHLAATFSRASRQLTKQGIAATTIDRPAFFMAAARQLKEEALILPKWPQYAADLTRAATSVSQELAAEVEAVLQQTVPARELETIPELRRRTGTMALANPTSFDSAAAAHLSDADCARCVLGLQPGVLPAADWSYMYLIGDELRTRDPYGMSTRVDHYYDLLARCRDKRERATTINESYSYQQTTEYQLLTTLLMRLDNKSVVDVGAELGSFVAAALHAGASNIVAVEPHPTNVAALREQFGTTPSVSILDIALGARNGPATLYVAEDKTGEKSHAYHSLVAFGETPTIRRIGEIQVQCQTLESLVQAGTVPQELGALKIDAERSDFDIVRGMGSLRPDVVMLEFWDDLEQTVGKSPYRLRDVADWMSERGYANFAVVKRSDEFETIQINDADTRTGDWGNVIFVNDKVWPALCEVIYSAAGGAQRRLIDKAKMFADEARNRISVIEQQQQRIQTLEDEPTPSEALESDTLSGVSLARTVDPLLATQNGNPGDAVLKLMLDQVETLHEIRTHLIETKTTYERAREEMETEFRNRLQLLELRRTEAEAASAARLAVIQEQQRALEHYRYWWWAERLRRSWSPKLGVLYQYAPRTIDIPARYLRLPSMKAVPPTISIVTPTLNQGVFIERTIRSVLDQQYPDLEYIVQDALSSDETPRVLERYADILAHVDSSKDSGFADGINKGFAHATGQIMAYLNSDDILLPGTLHYVAAFLVSHPDVDVVYGHRVVIDEYDAEVGRWVLPEHDNHVLSWADYVPQETMFWRRRIWDQTGGAIDESFRFAIDWDLLLRFRDAGARIARLPRFLGAFRVHPHQKTSSDMDEIGSREMALLRERSHGRTVTSAEIGAALRPYLRKHIAYHKLYRLGLLRY